MFEIVIKANLCFELTWEIETMQYDTRDGPYLNTNKRTKQFATAAEAKQFQLNTMKSEKTKNWQLVKKEIIPL